VALDAYDVGEAHAKWFEYQQKWEKSMKRIAALEAKNARLKKQITMQSDHCDRKHGFCPDCRDKLPDNFCWRCESQRLETENARLREAHDDYHDAYIQASQRAMAAEAEIESLKSQLHDATWQLEECHRQIEMLDDKDMPPLIDKAKLRAALKKTAIRAWMLSKKKNAIGREWLELREASNNLIIEICFFLNMPDHVSPDVHEQAQGNLNLAINTLNHVLLTDKEAHENNIEAAIGRME